MRKSLRLLAVLGVLALLGGCSSSQGECSYDTDCPQHCFVCDISRHVCVEDPVCTGTEEGKCTQDSDCDPVLEACVAGYCRLINQPDGSTTDDGDGWVRPDDPECQTADCTEAGLPGQGRDVDGDGWGRCCDCDDLDIGVNPGKREIVYTCKDEDCDPETPDNDLDNDGYGKVGICGGTDCDDRNPNINPGAAEVCDGLDNDCDGNTEGPGVCPDGGLDGADIVADCPNLAGHYLITAHCANISDGEADISQTGCTLDFLIGGIHCTGSIDAALNFYVECVGIGFPCRAKASLTSAFTVTCSEQCTFLFSKSDQGSPCAYHDDPACTANGEVCGIVGDSGTPSQVCVTPNPQGHQPGFYCEDASQCFNSLCTNNFCGGICGENRHCQAFEGTTCQTVLYEDLTQVPPVSGNIQVCGPENAGETRCGRTPDCPLNRVCSYRQKNDDVITVCRMPNPGGGLAGATCDDGTDCETNICLCNGALCTAPEVGVCSEVCSSGSDCLQGYACGAVTIPDLLGTLRTVPACVRDSTSCGRDIDCPAGKSCQVFLSPEGDSLVTECYWGGGQGVPNTGANCSTDMQCYSALCFDYPGYCHSVCISDADCPTFEKDPVQACDTHEDCDLGWLCAADDTCQRDFDCRTMVFYLGTDLYGQPIYDTANMCMPDRQICLKEQECRPGESCKLYLNDTATAPSTQCAAGGPGSGTLGTDCYPAGSDACWNGLCLMESGGGAGNQYCSQICELDTDCDNDPATWACVPVTVEIRTGYVGWIMSCARR